MDSNQSWLTVREVATELQVHEETVRRWIRSGELPAIELGGTRNMYRIRPAALGTFMRQRTHGRTAELPTEAPEPQAPTRTADFRQLVEHLPMVTFVLDPAARDRRGSLLYISPEVEQILGVPVNEWYENLDQVWPTLLTPDQYQRLVDLSAHMRSTSEHYSIDVRMVNRRTGAPVWVSLDLEVDRPDPAGPALWFGLLVDITDRKQLEERLQMQVQTLGSLTARLLSAVTLDSMTFEALRELSRALPVQLARWNAIGVGGRTVTTYALDWESDQPPTLENLRITRSELPRNSLARHVLTTEEGVRVADLRLEQHFSGERDLLSAGLCSALAAPIRDQMRIVGVLETFATEPDAYMTSDRRYLETTAGIAALALARQGERWMTVPEVASMLDVQPETVRRWIRQGALVAAMPGGVRAGYRVDAAQLDAFLQRRKPRAAS